MRLKSVRANVSCMIGVGAYLVAKKLTNSQRQALEHLAPYLKSIRKMVKALGPNVLDDYCRQGHLSQEKISDLDKLEACLTEERIGSGDEEEEEEEEEENAESRLGSNESDSEG